MEFLNGEYLIEKGVEVIVMATDGLKNLNKFFFFETSIFFQNVNLVEKTSGSALSSLGKGNIHIVNLARSEC
jgi:hypothetical protein